jgi:hypothetical protein
MHFFTDHQNLPAQGVTGKYGPVAADPINKYNVTSLFQTTANLKAFSCQTGLLIVQQSKSNTSLVNVIIKPTEDLKIPFQRVAYYIYRGILKSSLISGVNIISKDSSDKNELITRIYNAKPGSDSFAAGILGFDNNTLSDSTHIEGIFYSKSLLKPIKINEGEWFGNFQTGNIAFEVIMEADKVKIDLGFVRNSTIQIDATGLSGAALQKKKQEILGFIDPAAFWGLHFENGVTVSTYSANIKNNTDQKGIALYNTIVSKYVTKNYVYLDIRSENGYSYNYYQNYTDGSANDFQLGYSDVNPTTQKYETNGWPVIHIESSQTTTLGQNSIRFNLRLNDNDKPIIFRQTNIKNKSLFTDIKSGTSVAWSKEVKILYPNVGSGASKSNVAYFIKILYFRQRSATAKPAKVFRNEKYYHSAFCSVDLANLAVTEFNIRSVDSPILNFINEPLQNNGTGNFAYVAGNGALWDNDRILFYSKLNSELSSSEKVFLPTYSQGITCINLNGNELKTNLDIICRKYQKGTGTSPAEVIQILGVNSYKKKSQKESLLLLGLSIKEINAIKGNTELSGYHNRFIYLERTTTDALRDKGLPTGNKYYEYRIRLQGFDLSGNATLVTPTIVRNPGDAAVQILVYSRDNMFFNSKEFGATEKLSKGQNQIEFHTYSDGCVKINDNIDLSLVVGAQKIFYFYHDAAKVSHQICSLTLFQSNKMAKGSIVKTNPASPPTGYTLTIDYTSYGVEAKHSYQNTRGDVVTIGTHNHNDYQVSYKNMNKKTFLVYFEDSLVNNAALNISFAFSNTRRRYAKPELAAAVIGALIDIAAPISSGGFSFSDSTCFPSQTHNNGEAIDTGYKMVLSADQSIINAMHKFGFSYILKGQASYFSGLTIAQAHADHNTHLHSGFLKLVSCNENL